MSKESQPNRKPCEWGCGGYPKTATAHFLPGHDLGKAYQDMKGRVPEEMPETNSPRATSQDGFAGRNLR